MHRSGLRRLAAHRMPTSHISHRRTASSSRPSIRRYPVRLSFQSCRQSNRDTRPGSGTENRGTTASRGLRRCTIGGMDWVLTPATSRNTSLCVPVITVKVPSETAIRVTRMAARRRVSKSTIVREALEEKLAPSSESPSVHDLMKPVLGALDGGLRDRGHNPKHLALFGRQ